MIKHKFKLEPDGKEFWVNRSEEAVLKILLQFSPHFTTLSRMAENIGLTTMSVKNILKDLRPIVISAGGVIENNYSRGYRVMKVTEFPK